MFKSKTNNAASTSDAQAAAQSMREMISVAEPKFRLWIGKMNAKARRASEIVRTEFKLTAVPQIFTSVGSQFSKSSEDCKVQLNGNSLELSFTEEMPRSLYERVVIPLCAAFNLTNGKQASITLNQVKK